VTVQMSGVTLLRQIEMEIANGNDLLRLVPLRRHVQLLYRVIFSYARWTSSSRSAHVVPAKFTSPLRHSVAFDFVVLYFR
jgi:hypothetical protein